MESLETRHVVAVDIGTGSVRAALVTQSGKVAAIHARPVTTHYPKHGWCEQDPEEWWALLCIVLMELFRKSPVNADTCDAICVCGHMHAVTPVDRSGNLVFRRVGLWNDKRAQEIVDSWQRSDLEIDTVNPPTSAWPAFKLAWYRKNQPADFARIARIMMPKDYVNFRLSGEIAMDPTEAGSSHLLDPGTMSWSPAALAAFGFSPDLLPPLVAPNTVIGRVTRQAADQTGLPQGLRVVAGGGDYPVAILGSGVTTAGQASDITGTSYLFTLLDPDPIRHEAVMNVATATNQWGAFAVVDAAGDAVRWANSVFVGSDRGFDDVLAQAAKVSPGAEGLLFLPYLTGERLARGGVSRAGFHGLSINHGPAHFQRAVMEGVALAMRDALTPILAQRPLPDQVIAAGGGARARLWLEIKASVLGTAIKPTAEPESGIIGAASLATSALETGSPPGGVARSFARYLSPIEPDPTLADIYAARLETFRLLRAQVAPVDLALEKETK